MMTQSDSVDFDEISAFLEDLNVKVFRIKRSAPSPLRDAFRGIDLTIGNRIRERRVVVDAMGLHGRPTSAGLLNQLVEKWWCIGIKENAQIATQPMLSVDSWPIQDESKQRLGFHGIRYGMIDVHLEITILEFERISETP